MMKGNKALFFRFVPASIAASLFFLSFSALHAQKDAEGCRDHPLFNRMPNFYLHSCEHKDYGSAEFIGEKGDPFEREGELTTISYRLKEGFSSPGELKIVRNFEEAVRKVGGAVVYSSESDATLKIEQPGRTVWVLVDTSNDGEHYTLTIVEEKTMEQIIVADPKALAQSIAATGHASVYGIYFDVDSDVIKSESRPALDAVAGLLKEQPSLRVYVVGHTDMTGRADHNLDLSLRRAKSVVNELAKRYAIDPGRLTPQGVGPLAPVGSNRTEEGRKLNRRVELVERIE